MAGLSKYAGPWNRQAAAHLIYRAGFGATAATIEEMVSAGMDQCVDRLINFHKVADGYEKPDWAEPIPDLQATRKKLSDAERLKFLQERRKEGQDLKMWWIRRMVMTTRPFQEKLTLFWHGHFATSIQKVKLPYFMWMQNETLRRNSAGNWRKMLKDISKDPAMVIWLDNVSNRVKGPNENYARELMELFSLGEGNYTERDIKESARAFTGYSVDRDTQEFVFREKLHDKGTKHFFNRVGNFDGDDIVDIILARPQAPRFIAKKIWEFFCYQGPSDSLVDGLAGLLKSSNYEFRPLFKEIFTSEEFYSDRAVRKQIKSPIQWLVGSVLALQAELMPMRMINGVMRLLGQEVFEPPNVKGWDGGAAWITTASLLTRYNLANVMINGVIPDEMINAAAGRKNIAKKNDKKDGGEMMAEEGPSMEQMLQEERRQRVQARAKDAMSRQLQRLVDVGKVIDVGTVRDGREVAERLRDVLYLDGMSDKDLESIVEYVGNNFSEEKVRGAAHLMMSTPHYQLC
jgi:uncharacterized protein (DUF1800 family)